MDVPPPRGTGAPPPNLAAAVAELQQWRASLTSEHAPSGMLLQVAAAMRQEESYWEAELARAQAVLAAAQSNFDSAIHEAAARKGEANAPARPPRPPQSPQQEQRRVGKSARDIVVQPDRVKSEPGMKAEPIDVDPVPAVAVLDVDSQPSQLGQAGHPA